MKKIAKISLVAAVAVAGLTSANAQALEEAIKNVDVTGSVVYRYNDSHNDDKTNPAGQTIADRSNTTNNYKVALNAASKVNDDVKFNSRFLVTTSGQGDFAQLNTQTVGDANPGVSLSNAYFAYTGVKNTTVNVGKQGLTTPWTVAVDSDGNEQTGTGILALSTVGPVTLAGAYFNQTNIGSATDDAVVNTVLRTSPLVNANAAGKADAGAEDVATVGVIANLGVVTVDAWYIQMAQAFDSYTIGAKSNFDVSGAKLGVDARYVSLTLDENFARTAGYVDATNGLLDSNSIAKIALTAKAGIFDGKLAYAKTGSEGGLTALDRDASTTLLGWNLNAHNKVDADYWQAVAGVDILSNLNLSANYGTIEYAEDNQANPDIVKEEEIYAQLLYKMSKNLSTYVRYGVYSSDTKDSFGVVDTAAAVDNTRGRLQVEYTF